MVCEHEGTFGEIRKTAITDRFAQVRSEYDVMTLARYSDFATTQMSYLAVADGLVARARQAITHQVSPRLSEKCCNRAQQNLNLQSSDSKSEQVVHNSLWCKH